METIEDIRRKFRNLLYNKIFIEDKSGSKTLEILSANFLCNDDSIFGEVNNHYVQREIDWYKSKSLNILDIPPPIPKIWKDVADRNGNINSNYGWCVWDKKNCNQYYNVLRELQLFPNSRRAVMIYTRPSMWYDYNYNGMSDFMCTNTVQYFIRPSPLYGKKLFVNVQMRSNDAVFGFKNDLAWQRYIAKDLAADLGINQIDPVIHWNVGSLHVYERHFDLVKED